MRTAMCVVMALALMVTAAAAKDDFTYPGIPSATDGTFPELFNFGVEIGGDNRCVGVGYDGTYFWVSAGDGITGVCNFYIFDDFGVYQGTVPQGGGATGWGHRDLCFDGTYMYGSFSNQIHAFDMAMNYVGYFNGPINPCRALAYDGYYFYTCGFSEYLYRGHWNGVWGSTPTWEVISAATFSGCYGLAFDWYNNCLWMTTADYSGDLHQIGLDGAIQATHTTLPEYDIAGGCEMAGTSNFGMVLAVLQQFTPDTISFYDVDSSTAVEPTSWTSIKAMFQ